MRSSKKPAVILVGHGSKAKDFDKAMLQVLAALKKTGRYSSVISAYLEINSPSIPQAIETAIQDGAGEVRVLPYFLLTGRHVIEDIPVIVREAQLRYKGQAHITLCPYLGYDPKLVKLVQERVEQVAK